MALTRRSALGLCIGGGAALGLGACQDEGWYGIDVSGTLPDLYFELTRAGDGAVVTEADYRGQTVALFFGFTQCGGICPMTLSNLSAVANTLGPASSALSILFVTVDPERDSPATLARFVGSFSDRAAGFRGTDNQLARLTRRFRVTVKIEPHLPEVADYTVTHGKSVYLFSPGGRGAAHLAGIRHARGRYRRRRR